MHTVDREIKRKTERAKTQDLTYTAQKSEPIITKDRQTSTITAHEQDPI